MKDFKYDQDRVINELASTNLFGDNHEKQCCVYVDQ